MESISFTMEDAVGIQFPHVDVIVVSLSINNHNVHHVLFDGGNVVNILYYSTFFWINLSMEQLE